jgi:hypothetical protein
MTLDNYSTYAEYSSSFTAYLNGTQILNATGDDIIGIYSFEIAPGSNPSLSTPFWTTCLSPNGVLDTAQHKYDFDTFAQANPGIYPSAWANPGGAPLAGIQNANYIFSQIEGPILNGTSGQAGSSADQGAAMALAMYDALYNSTGYGSVATGSAQGGFYIPGLAGHVLADYNTDIGVLNTKQATVDQITQPTGYVLVPDPQAYGSDQDMILLATGIPQGSPVPEPATILAGALTLLPFGASTLRILRRNRAA